MNYGILSRVASIMQASGYTVDTENPDEELTFDSIQFVSALVGIEEEFKIVVPEEYLSGENLNTLQDYYTMVITIINRG